MSALIIEFPGAPLPCASRPASDAAPIEPAGLATKFADRLQPMPRRAGSYYGSCGPYGAGYSY